MLTLATTYGSLTVGGHVWTLNSDGHVLVDGEFAMYWQGTRLCECDQKLFLLGLDAQWYLWSGDHWVFEGTLPVEQVIASYPSVLAWNDGWWTLGPSGEVLRHGEHVDSGFGVELHVDDTSLYVKSDDDLWWKWTEVWEACEPPGSVTPGVTARSVAEFTDAIGVTTHLNYLDTAYYTKWDTVRDLLIESGIKHVREGIPKMDGWYYDRIRQWHNAGVRFLALLGNATHDQLALLVEQMPNIEAIEGLNEWDLNGGEDWANELRAYQQTFFQAADNDFRLVVLGPSLTSQAAFEAVGDLSAWMDLAQLHNYYGTRNPETTGWGDDGYGSLDWSKRMSAIVAPGMPIWTVETGYPTDPLHGPNMPDHDMPEAACVRYITRLLCEQFAQGIGRTYLYQFVDDFTSTGTIDSYATHGLVRSDGTPKATYHAVKNLIGRLNELGDGYGVLSYSVKELDVRHVLLATANGFALLLWLGVESMHPDTRELIGVDQRSVTLTLPPNYRIVSTLRMGDDGQWSDVELSASDQLTLVQIGAS